MRRTPISSMVLTLLAALLLVHPSTSAHAAEGRTRLRSPQRTTRARKPARKPHRISPKQAARLIDPGDHVFVPIGHHVPDSILGALKARGNDPKGGLSAKRPVRLHTFTMFTRHPDVFSPKIHAEPFFTGGVARKAVNEGWGSPMAMHLHAVPRAIAEGSVPLDVALLQVSKPRKRRVRGKDGKRRTIWEVNVGASLAATPEALDAAKLVVAEINPNVPRAKGAWIPMDKIDAVVESKAKLVYKAPAKVGEADRKIAAHVAKLIPKKATLQVGIGAVADAVVDGLVAQKIPLAGVRSELLGPALIKIIDAGLVKGKVEYTFAEGGAKDIKWLDNNKRVVARPTREINDWNKSSRIPRLWSVNTVLEVDTYGQAPAHATESKWLSGFGGAVNFARGAKDSKGGGSVLVLHATRRSKKSGKLLSNVVSQTRKLVTYSAADTQYIVTEHGIALPWATGLERAVAIANIADPAFRKGQLRSIARRHKRSVGEVESLSRKIAEKMEREYGVVATAK